MKHLAQEDHADLGVVDNDNTEMLTAPAESGGCTPGEGRSYPSVPQETKGKTMVTPTEDAAQTWRDIAEQLTPEQVAGLERSERWFSELNTVDAETARTFLLELACERASFNTADALLRDVSMPSGAQLDGEGWGRDQDGRWSRALLWRSFGPERATVSVAIDGSQYADGTHTRGISLYADDREHMSSDEARQLAGTLLEAADELDRQL